MFSLTSNNYQSENVNFLQSRKYRETKICMATLLFLRNSNIISLYELFNAFQMELFQPHCQCRFWLSSIRFIMSMHVGSFTFIKVDSLSLIIVTIRILRWKFSLKHRNSISFGCKYSLNKGYCKYKNIFTMFSYFLVLYLCTVYDIDDFEVSFSNN